MENVWGWFYLGLHYAYGYGVKVELIKAENALAKAYDWKSECAGMRRPFWERCSWKRRRSGGSHGSVPA